ncbi:yfcG [Scenedesmus sp. PABB004]|nr:yfcG [Scenedesmus sp. PABB004]
MQTKLGARRAAPAAAAPARPVRRAAVAVRAAVKLYTNPASRGQIVAWYIKELGIEDQVEMVNLDMREKRQHKEPSFLKVNPFGKVPALQDGEFTLFESGALLSYLADKHGALPTPEARAKAAQWISFSNSTLSNAVFVEQFREKSMPDVYGALDKLLADREYLEGNAFSVSDVAVGSILLYVPMFFPQLDLSPYPNVLKYMERVKARPACAATVGSER